MPTTAGATQHGMQYSSLDQITTENVADLEEVWRVRTGELGQDSASSAASTPGPVRNDGVGTRFHETPMTYALEETGKQYIVIAAGGHPRMETTLGDYLVAFALPD